MKLILVALFSFPIFAYSQSVYKDSATVFAPGVVSTFLYERDMAISPDGREMYFTIQIPESRFSTIVVSHKTGNKWSTPKVAPFSGRFSDLEPAFSPDGKTLYFVSNRSMNSDSLKDYDIWYVTKTGKGWTAPVNIGAPVSTADDEFYPSVTSKGDLFFTAAYENATRKEDIYVARKSATGFSTPVALDSGVNSKLYEFNAFVSADEQYILFTSFGRPDDIGRGDLYISRRDSSGKWNKAVNLAFLNSSKLDYCPAISPDNKWLYFTSERQQVPAASASTNVSYDDLKKSHNSLMNGKGNVYAISFQAVIERLSGL